MKDSNFFTKLLLVDVEAEQTASHTGRVPQMPEAEGGLAHAPGDSAHVERPLDPEPLPGPG